jgi:hypothetical protein
MSLFQALHDLNQCCPYVTGNGIVISRVTCVYWLPEGANHFGYKLLFNGVPTSLSYVFDTFDEAVDWICRYPYLVEQKWSIAREVLNLTLIPDVVEYVVRDYVLD